MTYWGTNTYLIETPDGPMVLDPGPDDPAHVAAIRAAAPSIVAILLSHTHHDHLGATAALHQATGAPVHAWHAPAHPAFTPHIPLHDNQTAHGWQALHTPGHAADHLCFAGPAGVVFSADHVMSWSSSVVGLPGGDMAQYMASLRRMLARTDTLYLPGHGPPLPNPIPFVESLVGHREAREAAILDALQAGPHTAERLAAALYPALAPTLRRAAERNVTAHLQKLASEARVTDDARGWRRL